MATISKIAVYPVGTISGNNPEVVSLPEAASVTAVKGEPVYLSGGYVTECGDNPANILGILAEDGHNDSSAGDHDIAVYVANADTIFCGNVYNGVADADTTLAVTDVGRGFGLHRATSASKLYVSKDATGANVRVIVRKLLDAAGDTAGRVYFQFIQKYNQLLTTS